MYNINNQLFNHSTDIIRGLGSVLQGFHINGKEILLLVVCFSFLHCHITKKSEKEIHSIFSEKIYALRHF